MIKSLGIMMGGIFVGALGVEVLRRKYPGALDNLYARTREMASEAKEAFKNGYGSAVRPQQAAEPAA